MYLLAPALESKIDLFRPELPFPQQKKSKFEKQPNIHLLFSSVSISA